MRLLANRRELSRLIEQGTGVVLVDRSASGTKRSILHAAHCGWLTRVGSDTPVRFAPDRRSATTWLERNPGLKGRWRICPECQGNPVDFRRSTAATPRDEPIEESVAVTELVEPRLRPPIETLVSQDAGDARRYADRIAFVGRYERIAAAARGLAAVFAASIELHPHQVRVVRRVLDDPFQRYLLADEVGLGKTIEAGLVIRQRLVDAPRSIIVVLCPASLVWQWQDELDDRLGLRDLRPRGIDVVAYDEEPKAFERSVTPDLVVIDEAHRVAAGWSSEDPSARELFKNATRLGWGTPRLLLLSATPVLHHEQTLLAMLHLLDPDTFSLSTEAAKQFERRMRDRESLASVFARISSSSPGFIQRGALGELIEALPEDLRLGELAGSPIDALEGGQKLAATDLDAVRVHVSETYRVHRRLLRTRRESVADTAYRLRGRSGLVVVSDPDPRRDEADAWLTRWRSALVDEAGNDPDRQAVAVAAFTMFLERASGALEAMGGLARAAVTRRRSDHASAGTTPEEKRTLSELWHSDQLKRLLERLVEDLDVEDVEQRTRTWIGRIVHALDDRGGKAVVFASPVPTALTIAAVLRERFGTDAVAVFCADQDMDDRRAAIGKLRHHRRCRVLVCDRSGEEGLNLQEAGTVVHVDIPVATVRVEQRIGRLDRRSDGKAVTSILFEPRSGGFVDLWLKALRDGFKVFARSSAPLQYAVDTVESGFLRTLTLDGPGSAARLIPDLALGVEEEQEHIDRVDGLDALAGEATDDAELIEQYEAAESESELLAAAAATLLEQSGDDLGLADARSRRDGDVAFEVVRSSVESRRYPGVEEFGVQLVTAREAALRDPAVRLARPGTPGLDLVRRLLEDDEPNHTFAVWETQAEDLGSTVAFCCDVLVRADVSEAFEAWQRHETEQPLQARAHRSAADAPLDRAAFQRRADAYLAPALVRVWLDSAGEIIEQAAEVDALEATVAGARSEQWSPAAWRRAEVLANVDAFESLTGTLVEAATAEALRQAALNDDPQVAYASMAAHIELDLLHLQLRAARERSEQSAQREHEAMEAVLPALGRAVEEPVAKIVGAGIVVLSFEPRPGADE